MTATISATAKCQEVRNVALGTPYVTIFNCSDGSITNAPDLPHPMNHNAAAVTPDGYIHAIGNDGYLRPDLGRNSSSHYVWKFNMQGQGSWEERASLLGTTGTAACQCYDGKIYCFGGAKNIKEETNADVSVSLCDDSNTPSCSTHAVDLELIACSIAPPCMQIYDPATNTWAKGALMPASADHIASYTYKDKLGVVGGRGNFKPFPNGDSSKLEYPVDHYATVISMHAWHTPDRQLGHPCSSAHCQSFHQCSSDAPSRWGRFCTTYSY